MASSSQNKMQTQSRPTASILNHLIGRRSDSVLPLLIILPLLMSRQERCSAFNFTHPISQKYTDVKTNTFKNVNTLGSGLQNVDLIGFLEDAAPYLPEQTRPGIDRMLKMRDIADEIQNIGTIGMGGAFSAAPSDTRRPLDKPLGLLNAFQRHSTISQDTGLGHIQQVMQTMDSIQSGVSNLLQLSRLQGLGNGQNLFQALSNLGNVIPGTLVSHPAEEHKEEENTPAEPLPAAPVQTSGLDLAGTINQVLSGMDEQRRQQLLSMAGNLLSNIKK